MSEKGYFVTYRPPKKREGRNIGPSDYDADKIDSNENERLTVKKEIISLLKYLPLLVIIGASIVIVGNLIPEYIAIIVLGGLALVMVWLWCRERLRYW